MISYDEMNEITYAVAVADYSDLLTSLADGWTEQDVMNDFKECIGRGGDGFLETMSDDELADFAASVARRIN